MYTHIRHTYVPLSLYVCVRVSDRVWDEVFWGAGKQTGSR